MPEITQHYTVNLMTLSPLHIGSGRELQRDYDYVARGGYTWRVDEDRLLEARLGSETFDPALLGQPAGKLLQPGDYRPDSGLFRYVVKGVPRSADSGARLHEQIKDAYDRPYLPGSSLKGAFRTALFDWGLAHNPKALDTGRMGDNRKWATQPIERAVLGRDPNHDLLRALQVADSTPLKPSKVLSIENAQVLTPGGPGSPIEVEALRVGVRLRTTIKLDLALFAPRAEGELRLGDRLAWLRDLMGVCRARAKLVLAAECAWFGRHFPGSPAAEFYAQLEDQLAGLQDERCLLQVGWGGGWLNKTVGQRLNEQQREEIIGRYRLARGRRQRGDAFPKSRRVMLDTQDQPAAPLGWLLVEMKPEVAG